MTVAIFCMILQKKDPAYLQCYLDLSLATGTSSYVNRNLRLSSEGVDQQY